MKNSLIIMIKDKEFKKVMICLSAGVVISIVIGLSIGSNFEEMMQLQRDFEVVHRYVYAPKLYEHENSQDIDTNISTSIYKDFASEPMSSLIEKLQCENVIKVHTFLNSDGKISSNEFKESLIVPITECFEEMYQISIYVD